MCALQYFSFFTILYEILTPIKRLRMNTDGIDECETLNVTDKF